MVNLEIQGECAQLSGSWNYPLIPLTRSDVVMEKHIGREGGDVGRERKKVGRTVFW